MKKLFLFLPILMLLMISCGTSSSVVRLSPSIRPSIDVDLVTVYQTEAEVPSEFEKIAVVTIKGSAVYKTKASMLRALREKAGLLGANAIILAGSKDQTIATKAVSVYLTAGIFGKKEVSAIAIYVYPEKK